MAAWDLTALVNAADPKAGLAERHLWLVRLFEWLRHAPASTDGLPGAEPRTPRPVLRIRHLLNVLESNPALADRVRGLMRAFWREVDAASLFADFGFGARQSIGAELRSRIQAQWLPGTPETADLAALFRLLAEPGDGDWIEALDDATLARLESIVEAPNWRGMLLDAITLLASAVQAAGHSPMLRQRMDAALLADEPFRQLSAAASALRSAVEAGNRVEALQHATYLRALLDTCSRAADSVTAHLERYGVSADIVFALDRLKARCERIEQLLACLLAPEVVPEWRALFASLARTLERESGVRALLARNYSMLARRVTERHAETGEHYITRDRAEYRDMLRRAAGGGAVIAVTVFAKFAIAALGLTVFWAGFWAGMNYSASFLLVMLLQWTVATKQPAMTAPSLAESLAEAGSGRTGDEGPSDAAIESFVDRVAQLTRSQAAGIIGNVAMCAPIVLGVQWLAAALIGTPAVPEKQAATVLSSLSLLGPTALFAAFTGVLLFASSLIAGYVENWFVFHRLDSALAWNPRIIATLGPARARHWAAWWRANISGVAAAVSLGFLLGLVPTLLAFFAIPLDVRHVTLATGQLAAALGAVGWPMLANPDFWWCVLAIPVIGLLNVTVSFFFAFKLALRARGLRVRERSSIYAAIRRRLRAEPLSFFWPPREG